MKKRIFTLFLSWVMLLCIVAFAGAEGEKSAPVSRPGEYSGYSEVEYDGYNRYSVYVPVTDGTQIAVDYCIPTKEGVEAAQALPAVFTWTPYGRQRNDNMTSAEWFTSYGYAFVAADVRGMSSSYGVRDAANSAQEAQDGADIAAWIDEQPWCNGKIGTIGSSYVGQTQLAILSKSKDIDASVIGCTDYNKYDGWIRGGIPRAFGSQPDTLWGETEEEIQATIDAQMEKAVPVDADADRTMLREAISQHVANGLQIPMFQRLLWRDSFAEETHGEYWNQVSASSNKEAINTSGSAVYVMGGLYDVFRRDSFVTYANLTGPKKLTIGPWYHTKPKVDPDWNIEQLRWFDYWLKGIDNGIMDEDPIYLKTANREENNGYAWHTEWNPAAGIRTNLYFDSAEGLKLAQTRNEAEAYVDYDAVYGIATGVESADAADVEEKGLCFKMDVAQDMEITGHAMAHIFFEMMSEGYDDVDFFVSVADYNPETGESFLFDDGHLRASLRSTAEAPYDFLGLPWHPANQADAQPIHTGEVYELVIDLMPTSYIVKAGHELRITLSNAMDRFYYLGRSAYEADPACAVPTVRVYTGGEKASYIELPDIYHETAQAATGTYIGKTLSNGIVKFSDIAYATTERWQAPVPVPESDDVIRADADLTRLTVQTRAPGKPQQEGILTLDIYANPEGKAEKKGVFVWNTCGGGTASDSNAFDPTQMLLENPDIVAVVVNIRVGYFGCINLEAFEDYDSYTDPKTGENPYQYANNLMRLDYLAALKWVKQNIAAFGGNPDMVTIAGQSAGAANASAMLLIEEAHDYFNQVILESGVAIDRISVAPLSENTFATEKFQQYVNGTMEDKKPVASEKPVTTIAEALTLDAEKFATAQNGLTANSIGAYPKGCQGKSFSNVADGIVIPAAVEDYWAAIEKAAARGIRILVGSTCGEYDRDLAGKSAEEALNDIISANWGKLAAIDPATGTAAVNGTEPSEQAKAILEGYVQRGMQSESEYARDTVTACKDLKNDINQRVSAVMIAEAFAKESTAYLWGYEWYAPNADGNRATHGSEKQALYPAAAYAGPEALGKAMRNAWASFVAYGDPNIGNACFEEAQVEWKPYDVKNDWIMLFGETMTCAAGQRMEDIESLMPLFAEYTCLRPAVKAPTGTYIGQEQPNGTYAFKGIQYATAGRFEAPVVVPESEDTFLCYKHGPSSDAGDPGALNLVVYVNPESTGKEKSVFMWQYGSAQRGGSTSKTDWSEFVKKNPDIIVVTPNHRGGFWGSIDLSALEGYDKVEETYRCSNNLARLDLLACLKWINQNIAAFGGNPADVTIGGHSSGSNNVTCLLLMEEAHPYFSKAACQASFSVDISLQPLEDARFVSGDLFERLGVKTVDELLAIDADAINQAMKDINASSMSGSSAYANIECKLFSAVVDGVVIPNDYYERLLSSESLKGKKLMFGSNAGEYDQQYVDKEGKPLSDEAALEFTINQNWGKLSERGWNRDNAQAIIDAFYSHNEEYGRDAWTAAKDLKNDLYLRCGAIMFAEAVSRYTDTYFYHLDWDITPENNLRASHGSENNVINRTWDAVPENMLEDADILSNTWAAFIRTGDPNNESLPVTWTRYNGMDHSTMYFAPSLKDSRMVNGQRQKDVDLLLPLFREYPLLEKALNP